MIHVEGLSAAEQREAAQEAIQATLDAMPPKAREAWERGKQMGEARKEYARRHAMSETAPIMAMLTATAQRPAAMPERISEGRAFAAMRPLERARLKQTDSARYARMRAAAIREREAVVARLRGARSHAEYSAIRRELAGLPER